MMLKGYMRLEHTVPDDVLGQLEQEIRPAVQAQRPLEEDEIQLCLAHLVRDTAFRSDLKALAGEMEICFGGTLYPDFREDGLWHQDTRISCRLVRQAPPGFGPVTYAGNRCLLKAPDAFLRRVVNLEIYFRETDWDSGAVQIVPGSHREGRIAENIMQYHADEDQIAYVPARRGEVHLYHALVLMRREMPDMNRDVNRLSGATSLKLSLAPRDLPPPLEWFMQVDV